MLWVPGLCPVLWGRGLIHAPWKHLSLKETRRQGGSVTLLTQLSPDPQSTQDWGPRLSDTCISVDNVSPSEVRFLMEGLEILKAAWQKPEKCMAGMERGFLVVAQQVKNLPATQEAQDMLIQSRGQEDPLEESLGAQRHGMDRARVGRVSTAEQAWSVPVHLSELIPVNEG